MTILEDNVHQCGPGAAGTAGKLLVFGKGLFFERFLCNVVKYNSKEFFCYVNTYDFKKLEVQEEKKAEELEKREDEEEIVEVDESSNEDSESEEAMHSKQPTK